MRLKYTKKDGTQMEFELSERPITIGRSPEADVVILDEKASRIHCGIRLWDGEFYVKDLKSRNGTYVNDQRVDVVKLKSGDRIRVGNILFSFDQDPNKSAGVALQEVEEEMAQGKGYSTILQEIVGGMEQPTATGLATPAGATDAPGAAPVKIKARKPKSPQ
jgi:pSer/pThr/pTyr-binding forkhead associated (FHA) protein